MTQLTDNECSFYLFGDSITYGQLVTSHKTWATALAETLPASCSDYSAYLVQNAGVNGNTTRQGLERMSYDVLSHSPDFVMVQFGLNDCNYWETDRGFPRVSQKAFVANLEEIVRRALNAGARHCFLNTNHPTLKGPFSHIENKTYEQSNIEYNQLIRSTYDELANDKLPITLIDIEAYWSDLLSASREIALRDLLLPDGIHLSEKGHQAYRSFLIPKVLEYFENYKKR